MSAHKDLFRLVAIGSVDDGKSTLIGRLLYESGAVYADQIEAVRGDRIDFAALTDGLAAEREQGITIDVAYRFWDTPTRRFIIADTPGHLQYTRNMVTGSSTANAAIILIDAQLGVLEQSRRHAYIASLLGVQTLIVAVNKMDAVGYEQQVFQEIQRAFEKDLSTMGSKAHRFVPISALEGDNVVHTSSNMPWYKGASLVQDLEQAPVTQHEAPGNGMVLPIQTVLRASGHRRGYAGTVLGDRVSAGDAVIALPSNKRTRIAKVINPSNDADYALAHSATQVQLEDELDLSRGEVLVAASRDQSMHRRAVASLVWMHEDPLVVSRNYLIKLCTKLVSASVTRIVHRMDLQDLSAVPSDTLELNQIATIELVLSEPCLIEPYPQSRELGSFVLIDRSSYATVAAGMIDSVSSGTELAQDRHEQRSRRFAQTAAHLVLQGNRESVDRLAAQLESHLTTLGHLAFAVELEPEDRPHHQAIVRALLQSGQLVIETQACETPQGWTRVELSANAQMTREEQLDALVLDLGARGILGPKLQRTNR